jgi:hypothetical protein
VSTVRSCRAYSATCAGSPPPTATSRNVDDAVSCSSARYSRSRLRRASDTASARASAARRSRSTSTRALDRRNRTNASRDSAHSTTSRGTTTSAPPNAARCTASNPAVTGTATFGAHSHCTVIAVIVSTCSAHGPGQSCTTQIATTRTTADTSASGAARPVRPVQQSTAAPTTIRPKSAHPSGRSGAVSSPNAPTSTSPTPRNGPANRRADTRNSASTLASRTPGTRRP